MHPRYPLLILMLLGVTLAASTTQASEAPRHYENRFRIMLDVAVRINEYGRVHLMDKRLCAWVHAIAETNAREAEQMSPPKQYAILHPHFLLVVNNIERAYYHAARNNMERYRHHQRIIRRELNILEALAERAGLSSYRDRY